jgi:hypothetical protein
VERTAGTESAGCSGGQWQGNTCHCPEGTVFDAGACAESDHGGVNCAAFGEFYDGAACVKGCPRGTNGKQGYCAQD